MNDCMDEAGVLGHLSQASLLDSSTLAPSLIGSGKTLQITL